MPTEYIPAVATAFVNLLEEVLGLEEFCEFAANGITVKLALKATFKKDELAESKPTVKIAKCPPLWKELGDLPDYVVVVDKFAWDDSDENAKRRLLHLALSSLAVEVKADGSFKVSRKHPDVVTYKTTVNRYGLDTHERDVLSTITRTSRQVADSLVAVGRGEEE